MGVFEKKGWFRITVPPGWEVEGGEDPVAIYRSDGPGALQVTAQAPPPLRPGERIDVFLMLRAYLRGIGVDMDAARAERSFERGLEWAWCEYVEKGAAEGPAYWRVWMVTDHDVLVFLTYTCPQEDRELERKAVEEIVATLELPGRAPSSPAPGA